MSSADRYAERLGVVEHNPVSSVVPPAFEKREIFPPDVTGVRRMLELARAEGHPLYPLLHLAPYTGMRRGEALALRWENVNLVGPSLQAMESAAKTRHGGTVVVSHNVGVVACFSQRLGRTVMYNSRRVCLHDPAGVSRANCQNR